MFDRGQLGDFLDALRVENVVAIEVVQRSLLDVIDGGVFQHIAGQVVADLADDIVAETAARLVQVDKVHRLAHRLQRFGKLRFKQGLQRFLVRRAHAAHRLRHFQHIFGGLVDVQEEGDLDIGANIVHANQAILAHAADLDGLERDFHQLFLVDDRIDHAAGKGDLGRGAQGIDDHDVALLYLMVELGEHHQQTEHDDDDETDRESHNFHDFLVIPVG